jgi:hypothetical protein
MKYLLIAAILALQAVTVTAEIVPPREVQVLVKAILDLRSKAECSQGEQQQSAFQQSEKLMGRLFQKKSAAADEALVVLMNFYVGESIQADLIHQVTTRGKRMLPLLLKYKKASVAFSKVEYPKSMLVADDVRKKSFDDAIAAVRAGKVVGED